MDTILFSDFTIRECNIDLCFDIYTLISVSFGIMPHTMKEQFDTSNEPVFPGLWIGYPFFLLSQL